MLMNRARGGPVITPLQLPLGPHFHYSPLPKRNPQHRYVTPHLNMLGGDQLLRHAMKCSRVELQRCAVVEVLVPPPTLTLQHGDNNRKLS